jgi:hypothetical protein
MFHFEYNNSMLVHIFICTLRFRVYVVIYLCILMVFFIRIAGILMVYVAVKHNAIPAYTIVCSCYLLTYDDGECDWAGKNC